MTKIQNTVSVIRILRFVLVPPSGILVDTIKSKI